MITLCWSFKNLADEKSTKIDHYLETKKNIDDAFNRTNENIKKLISFASKSIPTKNKSVLKPVLSKTSLFYNTYWKKVGELTRNELRVFGAQFVTRYKSMFTTLQLNGATDVTNRLLKTWGTGIDNISNDPLLSDNEKYFAPNESSEMNQVLNRYETDWKSELGDDKLEPSQPRLALESLLNNTNTYVNSELKNMQTTAQKSLELLLKCIQIAKDLRKLAKYSRSGYEKFEHQMDDLQECVQASKILQVPGITDPLQTVDRRKLFDINFDDSEFNLPDDDDLSALPEEKDKNGDDTNDFTAASPDKLPEVGNDKSVLGGNKGIPRNRNDSKGNNDPVSRNIESEENEEEDESYEPMNEMRTYNDTNTENSTGEFPKMVRRLPRRPGAQRQRNLIPTMKYPNQGKQNFPLGGFNQIRKLYRNRTTNGQPMIGGEEEDNDEEDYELDEQGTPIVDKTGKPIRRPKTRSGLQSQGRNNEDNADLDYPVLNKNKKPRRTTNGQSPIGGEEEEDEEEDYELDEQGTPIVDKTGKPIRRPKTRSGLQSQGRNNEDNADLDYPVLNKNKKPRRTTNGQSPIGGEEEEDDEEDYELDEQGKPIVDKNGKPIRRPKTRSGQNRKPIVSPVAPGDLPTEEEELSGELDEQGKPIKRQTSFRGEPTTKRILNPFQSPISSVPTFFEKPEDQTGRVAKYTAEPNDMRRLTDTAFSTPGTPSALTRGQSNYPNHNGQYNDEYENPNEGNSSPDNGSRELLRRPERRQKQNGLPHEDQSEDDPVDKAWNNGNEDYVDPSGTNITPNNRRRIEPTEEQQNKIPKEGVRSTGRKSIPEGISPEGETIIDPITKRSLIPEEDEEYEDDDDDDNGNNEGNSGKPKRKRRKIDPSKVKLPSETSNDNVKENPKITDSLSTSRDNSTNTENMEKTNDPARRGSLYVEEDEEEEEDEDDENVNGNQTGNNTKPKRKRKRRLNGVPKMSSDGADLINKPAGENSTRKIPQIGDFKSPNDFGILPKATSLQESEDPDREKQTMPRDQTNNPNHKWQDNEEHENPNEGNSSPENRPRQLLRRPDRRQKLNGLPHEDQSEDDPRDKALNNGNEDYIDPNGTTPNNRRRNEPTSQQLNGIPKQDGRSLPEGISPEGETNIDPRKKGSLIFEEDYEFEYEDDDNDNGDHKGNSGKPKRKRKKRPNDLSKVKLPSENINDDVKENSEITDPLRLSKNNPPSTGQTEKTNVNPLRRESPYTEEEEDDEYVDGKQTGKNKKPKRGMKRMLNGIPKESSDSDDDTNKPAQEIPQNNNMRLGNSGLTEENRNDDNHKELDDPEHGDKLNTLKENPQIAGNINFPQTRNDNEQDLEAPMKPDRNNGKALPKDPLMDDKSFNGKDKPTTQENENRTQNNTKEIYCNGYTWPALLHTANEKKDSPLQYSIDMTPVKLQKVRAEIKDIIEDIRNKVIAAKRPTETQLKRATDMVIDEVIQQFQALHNVFRLHLRTDAGYFFNLLKDSVVRARETSSSLRPKLEEIYHSKEVSDTPFWEKVRTMFNGDFDLKGHFEAIVYARPLQKPPQTPAETKNLSLIHLELILDESENLLTGIECTMLNLYNYLTKGVQAIRKIRKKLKGGVNSDMDIDAEKDLRKSLEVFNLIYDRKKSDTKKHDKLMNPFDNTDENDDQELEEVKPNQIIPDEENDSKNNIHAAENVPHDNNEFEGIQNPTKSASPGSNSARNGDLQENTPASISDSKRDWPHGIPDKFNNEGGRNEENPSEVWPHGKQTLPNNADESNLPYRMPYNYNNEDGRSSMLGSTPDKYNNERGTNNGSPRQNNWPGFIPGTYNSAGEKNNESPSRFSPIRESEFQPNHNSNEFPSSLQHNTPRHRTYIPRHSSQPVNHPRYKPHRFNISGIPTYTMKYRQPSLGNRNTPVNNNLESGSSEPVPEYEPPTQVMRTIRDDDKNKDSPQSDGSFHKTPANGASYLNPVKSPWVSKTPFQQSNHPQNYNNNPQGDRAEDLKPLGDGSDIDNGGRDLNREKSPWGSTPPFQQRSDPQNYNDNPQGHRAQDPKLSYTQSENPNRDGSGIDNGGSDQNRETSPWRSKPSSQQKFNPPNYNDNPQGYRVHDLNPSYTQSENPYGDGRGIVNGGRDLNRENSPKTTSRDDDSAELSGIDDEKAPSGRRDHTLEERDDGAKDSDHPKGLWRSTTNPQEGRKQWSPRQRDLKRTPSMDSPQAEKYQRYKPKRSHPHNPLNLIPAAIPREQPNQIHGINKTETGPFIVERDEPDAIKSKVHNPLSITSRDEERLSDSNDEDISALLEKFPNTPRNNNGKNLKKNSDDVKKNDNINKDDEYLKEIDDERTRSGRRDPNFIEEEMENPSRNSETSPKKFNTPENQVRDINNENKLQPDNTNKYKPAKVIVKAVPQNKINQNDEPQGVEDISPRNQIPSVKANNYEDDDDSAELSGIDDEKAPSGRRDHTLDEPQNPSVLPNDTGSSSGNKGTRKQPARRRKKKSIGKKITKGHLLIVNSDGSVTYKKVDPDEVTDLIPTHGEFVFENNTDRRKTKMIQITDQEKLEQLSKNAQKFDLTSNAQIPDYLLKELRRVNKAGGIVDAINNNVSLPMDLSRHAQNLVLTHVVDADAASGENTQ